MIETQSLTGLARGDKAIVTGLTSPEAIRGRLMDIGLVEGTVVECVGESPLGDPSAYQIKGAIIALRRQDSDTVQIQSL